MSRGFRVGRANKDFAIFVDKNVWEVHGMCMEVNSKCSLVLHDIFLEGFGHSKVYFWLLSFFFSRHVTAASPPKQTVRPQCDF